MSLKVFLELIEVKAKAASLLPFLLGVGYSIWYYHAFDWRVMLVFLIAMLLFNMAVDVMDNYNAVSYTHLRAHETRHDLVCRLLLFGWDLLFIWSLSTVRAAGG